MVNRVSKFIDKNRNRISSEVAGSLYDSAVKGEQFSETDEELAVKRQLLHIHEATEDDTLLELLSQKIFKKVVEPAVDSNGFLVFQKDSAGNVFLDGNGEPLLQKSVSYKVNPVYAAFYTHLSKLNRLSFINPKDARLYRLQLKSTLLDARMSLDEDEINSGEMTFLNALYQHGLILLNDATNGHKVTTLFTLRKESSQDVNLRNQSEKKEVF